MTSSHILMPSRNDERKLQNEEICKYKNKIYEYSIIEFGNLVLEKVFIL